MADPVEKSPEAPGSAGCSQRRFSASRRGKIKEGPIVGHLTERKDMNWLWMYVILYMKRNILLCITSVIMFVFILLYFIYYHLNHYYHIP